jgi:hypothetical protein
VILNDQEDTMAAPRKATGARKTAAKKDDASKDDEQSGVVIQTTYQDEPNVSRYEGYVYFDKDEE